MLAVGPDNASVRVFRRPHCRRRRAPEFYRVNGRRALLWMPRPAAAGISRAARSRETEGTCLDRVEAIKDYWFDWRNYNPDTTVFGIKKRIQ